MTEDYTMDQLAELSLEEFANLIQKLGKYRFKIPKELQRQFLKPYVVPTG